jgi:hypothetical protein
LGFKPAFGEKKHTTRTSIKLPDTVDWRDQDVVNSIQDQGQCGSCWAFSAIQTIESIYAIKYTQLYKLSEQELVDCVTVDYGCDGGLMTDALIIFLDLKQDQLMNYQIIHIQPEMEHANIHLQQQLKFFQIILK